MSPGRRPPHRDRSPVVAWAQSAPIDYSQERAFLEDVMARVARVRPGTRFRLYGRRPGDGERILAPFRAMGLEVDWRPAMSYGRFVADLSRKRLQSRQVLREDPGLSRPGCAGPVVASDAADHELFFSRETGVIANDPATWAATIPALLEDWDRRQKMADRAFDAFRTELGLDAAARLTSAELARVLSAPPVSGGLFTAVA